MRQRIRGWRRWATVAVIGLGLALGGCATGAYPIDFYSEMHYQPSFRVQEPPTRPVPAESVPRTRTEVPYGYERQQEAARLTNPLPATPETVQRGQALYRRNCAPCHGPQGRGDGIIANYFRQANVPPPVDFTSDRVRGRTDGELFFYISNGIGNMPPFRTLMTEEERWALVAYIRSVGR